MVMVMVVVAHVQFARSYVPPDAHTAVQLDRRRRDCQQCTASRRQWRLDQGEGLDRARGEGLRLAASIVGGVTIATSSSEPLTRLDTAANARLG